MRAGQRLIDTNDNKEVMLFPLTSLYVSQGEGGSYSHSGTYNIDFLGWNNGREYNAPIYAPCSCRCVAVIGGSDNGRVFQSLDEVHIAQGTKSIITFMYFHDDNPIANVGDVFTQGQLLGHTGTAGNVTGDHIHFNTALGSYAGYEYVPPNNNFQLVNSNHIYNTCYVNDTDIIEGYGYNWRVYSGGYIPTIYSTKFNFMLFGFYAKFKRNFRNRRRRYL